MPDVFELIQQLCPDGVEYRRLGELGRFFGGVTGKSKADFVNGNAKFITYKNVYENASLCLDVIDTVCIRDGEKQRTLEYGDVLFTGSSETQAECGMSSVLTVYPAEPLYLNSFCFIFRFFDLSGVCPDFMKYLFRSTNLRMQICRTASGTTRFNVSKDKMKNICIPVPPMLVQEEIVRILDAFDTYCNDMTVGLAGELEMRRKQFQYWREQLIDRQHDYNAVLGHFFTQVSNKAGHGFPKEQLRVVSNTMGLVSKDDYEQRTQDASENLCNYKLVGSGEFVYNPRRFDVGSVAYNKESDDMAVSPAYQVFSVEGIHPDYLMHLFRHSGFHRQRIQYTEKGAGSKFTFDKFQYVSMPVPPMDIQLEIVAVLNKFQELERELERELELRKKQFEYYREKLLTFSEKVMN